MYAITSPVPQFFDLSGDPLDAGKIYIGTAGSNPVTSPVPVYWDDAGTQPASQPIRTVSGYPARNGKPANVYVATDDFSMAVFTSSDVVVQSELNVLSSSTLRADLADDSNALKGAAMVGYRNQTLRERLDQFPSAKDFGVVGDGVTDDTAAIATAIASSKCLFFPEGTYLCDEFVINVAGQSGRVIRGASTTGTIFKAKSGAVDFFRVTGNYNQFNTFENFSIDMSLMANVSTSRGLYLKQTWGNTFRNVNVVGSTANMRAMYCDVGTYTTVFDNCDFGSTVGVVQFQGISLSDAVTTVTLIGCAFGQCIADQVVSITFLQPVVQGSLNKFVLSNTSGFSILNGDIEGSGTYLVMGSAVGHLCSSNNEMSGFSGTYSSGTFVGGYLMDQYGNIPFKLSPVAGTVHDGPVTEQSAGALLLRKLLSNTNAVAQQVDIQLQNVVGSSYVGIKADGTTIVNGVSAKPIMLQQANTDRLGVDAASRLVIGTLTQTSVGSAGAAAALPANPSGYIRITIGGTDFVIPYYKQA